MDDFDQIWNLASELGAHGDTPDGTPPGLTSLSHLLRFYNSTMGGGLGFAFEVDEEFRIRRAIAAAAYLDLADLAAFWEDLLQHFPDYDYIESRYESYGTLVPNDGVIVAAFRSKATGTPGDFGL